MNTKSSESEQLASLSVHLKRINELIVQHLAGIYMPEGGDNVIRVLQEARRKLREGIMLVVNAYRGERYVLNVPAAHPGAS